MHAARLLHSVFGYPRCTSTFPGVTYRRLRCQSYPGHDSDGENHRNGGIEWVSPSPSGGNVHGLERRRR